jgi:DNA (cytosine-5)-methyltransferase 1
VTIGSLFSGIGGLELGLERAGLGPVAWQVEIDPFCRLVLERHWPKTARFEDVRGVGAACLAPVDVICGGFPCQDVSAAGKGAGLAGKRSGLWSEYRRIVSELRPEWVVVENVLGGATRWFDRVVCELEELGYGCLPIPLSAQDVGAPHLRRRVFIVANRRSQQRSLEQGRRKRSHRSDSVQLDWTCLQGATPDVDSEFSEQGTRRARKERTGGPELGSEAFADSHCVRELSTSKRRAIDGGRVDHGLEGDLPNPLSQGREGSRTGAHSGGFGPSSSGWWKSECSVAPVVHGISTRLAGGQRRRRIRALGNAVVPQCAEVVGWVIQELKVGSSCGGSQ